MMASSVTPPAEEEGEEVDGAVEAGGAVVSVRGYLKQSCARLHLTVAASMAHIYEKWGDSGKEIEKWRRSLMIAERKMRESVKCEGKSIERSSIRDNKKRARSSVIVL